MRASLSISLFSSRFRSAGVICTSPEIPGHMMFEVGELEEVADKSVMSLCGINHVKKGHLYGKGAQTWHCLHCHLMRQGRVVYVVGLSPQQSDAGERSRRLWKKLPLKQWNDCPILRLSSAGDCQAGSGAVERNGQDTVCQIFLNIDEDFYAYSVGRLQSCVTWMMTSCLWGVMMAAFKGCVTLDSLTPRGDCWL